eukprot:5985981-Amphidinium_carterae.1
MTWSVQKAATQRRQARAMGSVAFRADAPPVGTAACTLSTTSALPASSPRLARRICLVKNQKPASPNMEQTLKKQIANAKEDPALQKILQTALAAVHSRCSSGQAKPSRTKGRNSLRKPVRLWTRWTNLAKTKLMQEAAQTRDALREELATVSDCLSALGAFVQRVRTHIKELPLPKTPVATVSGVLMHHAGSASASGAPIRLLLAFTKNKAEEGDSEARFLCEKMELTHCDTQGAAEQRRDDVRGERKTVVALDG